MIGMQPSLLPLCRAGESLQGFKLYLQWRARYDLRGELKKSLVYTPFPGRIPILECTLEKVKEDFGVLENPRMKL